MSAKLSGMGVAQVMGVGALVDDRSAAQMLDQAAARAFDGDGGQASIRFRLSFIATFGHAVLRPV